MHTDLQALLDSLRLQSSGVPIYVQLRDQLLQAIGAGRLKPGEQMPTMRQVAVALRVDLNTVRRAYDELERMGAVELLRGRGSFVAPDPPAPDPETRTAQLDALARQTIATALAGGIDPAQLAERITALNSERERRT